MMMDICILFIKSSTFCVYMRDYVGKCAFLCACENVLKSIKRKQNIWLNFLLNKIILNHSDFGNPSNVLKILLLIGEVL